LNTKEVCCTQKALKGDFSDPVCNPETSKPFDWKFWGLVLLAIIILAVVGFFVYKKFFAPQVQLFYNGNIDNGNFNNNSDFNNGEFDNYGNEGIDVEDLEILNMPATNVSPVPSASPAPSVSPVESLIKSLSPVAK
jgi:hypothetical protein